MLKIAYDDYTKRISTSDAAISLETAFYLWDLCEKKNPNVVVDTGSGFSSFVLRLWAKQSKKEVIVYSFDDNEYWIEKSISFSKQHELDIRNFVIWNDRNISIKNADIVLHDLGDMSTRSRTLKIVSSMLNQHGTLILDDLHKTAYNTDAQTFFKSQRRTITKLAETIDAFGRFAGSVEF